MQKKQQQGGKFVFDGKRIQPVYERYACDFNSPYIYERFNEFYPNYRKSTNNCLDLSSQIINMKPSSDCNPKEAVCTKFVQMCINKMRSPVSSLCWCPDGRRVISGLNSGELTLWNGLTFNFDTILQAHSYPIKAMEWSRNKRLLITSDSNGIVKYWNLAMTNLNEITIHNAPIKDLSFSFNDAKFCTASDDSTIKIIDVFEGKIERTLIGHNWDIRKAKFHKSMALIASGGKDNLVKLWDPRQETALVTYHYHKNTILSMQFYKEYYLISGGKDQVIKMLDLRTMKEIFTYKNTGDVTALSCTDKIIVAGNNLGEINYWEEFNENIIASGDKTHDNTVWALDFHPAEHCLASGAADYQVRFWIRDRFNNKEITIEEVHNDLGIIPGLNL